MHADRSVHEPEPPPDPDSPLADSMEGTLEQPPASLITHFWSPGWNSDQSLNKFQEEVAGPLLGGDPGRRLLEPQPKSRPTFFPEVPDSLGERPGEFLAVPIPHIFGSDELSLLSPGVAALAPRPYVALSPEDAAVLGVAADGELEVVWDGVWGAFPVRLLPGLPRGLVGVPAGVPGALTLTAPAWVRLALRAREEGA
jgi:NADH-quinone oxidoreductase subunit G